MTNDDLARFRKSLEQREKLSPKTARKAASDVRTMRDHGVLPPQSEQLAARYKDRLYAWKLWADFCDAEGRRNTLKRPEAPLAPPPSNRRRRPGDGHKRLREAVSVPVADWKRFLRVVEGDDTMPGRVIDVLCSSALRIADVLRTPLSSLEEAFAREDGLTVIKVKGGKDIFYSVLAAPREWQRLYETAMRANAPVGPCIAQAVSPGSSWDGNSAAYMRCRRRLQELGRAAGIKDRMHLHRLRRTVAVLFTNETGNLFLTQKLLEHEDASTTKIYTDESNTLAVAKAMADFNRKMRGR